MNPNKAVKIGVLGPGATTTLPIDPPLEPGDQPVVQGDGIALREWTPVSVTIANETKKTRPWVLLLVPRRAVETGLAAGNALNAVGKFFRTIKGKEK
jgi:hypothetical protein